MQSKTINNVQITNNNSNNLDKSGNSSCNSSQGNQSKKNRKGKNINPKKNSIKNSNQNNKENIRQSMNSNTNVNTNNFNSNNNLMNNSNINISNGVCNSTKSQKNSNTNQNINIQSGLYNGIYDVNSSNYIHQNPNLNMINYNAILTNNGNYLQSHQLNSLQNTQNHLFVNQYSLNNLNAQGLIGQQIPLTFNIPAHQNIRGAIPVNIQTNGNYLYNYVGGINNSNNGINPHYQKVENLNVGNVGIFPGTQIDGDHLMQSRLF